MTASNQQHMEQAIRLYKRHVKPLEPEHSGKYVAVALDGAIFLGDSHLEVLSLAVAAEQYGSFVFKVGDWYSIGVERTPPESQGKFEQSLKVYQQYVKPLEADHWGKFAAVSPDGEVFLGRSQSEVTDLASAPAKPGGHIFKVGQIAVWKRNKRW